MEWGRGGGVRDLSCLTAGLQPCLPSKPGQQARKSGERLEMSIFGYKEAVMTCSHVT